MDKRLLSRPYVAIVVCAVVALVVALCVRRPAKRYMQASGVVWTTEYHITYEASLDMQDSIGRVLAMVDSSASVFNAQSVVSRLNNNEITATDSLFERLYAKSVEVNRASDGAYDPTVMPLVNAWGFGYKHGQLPTKAQIDSLLQFVGLGKSSIKNHQLVKQDGRLQFDFSSIAKGMACDEVGRMLERNGAENWIVEIGGEVACRGVNAQGQPWAVSVDMPQPDSHEGVVALTLKQGGVATSGNYRRFKEVDGKKVSHIVNPHTGYSEHSPLLSVTIVAPDCMTADAWATACMVMGPERCKQQFEHSQLGVMLISATPGGDLEVWGNKAFTNLVKQ